MNWWDRLKKFFFRDSRRDLYKIVRMREEQEYLEQRRDKLYEDLSTLEHREGDLLQQGRAATSQIQRRRLASQIFHLRQDLKRVNAVTGLVNRKITILATDIHNLSIVSEGQELGLKMPSAEELADNAVAAEQLIESVNQDAELCDQLINDQGDVLENAASYGGLEDIMAEFDDDHVVPQKTETQRHALSNDVMVEIPTAEFVAEAESEKITA